MNALRFFSWERGETALKAIAAWLCFAVPVVISYCLKSEGALLNLQALLWALATGAGVAIVVFLINLVIVPCAQFTTLIAAQQATQDAVGGKVQQLQVFLTAGITLKSERLTLEDEVPGWLDRYQVWSVAVLEWIKTEEDELSAARFNDVPKREPDDWRYALNEEHLAVRGELAEQCEMLELLIERATPSQEQNNGE